MQGKIDTKAAITKIKELIITWLEDSLVTSEQQLGFRIGVRQGTINRLKKGKYDHLPDLLTLEMLAIYQGQTVWQFIKFLFDECSTELTPEDRASAAVGLFSTIDDLKLLIQINKFLVNRISHVTELEDRE